MENKYTPGPWKVENGHYPNGYFLQTVVTEKESLANAKLIAAAPELLEALKDIIDCQFNPTKTLASLNGAISNAQQLLHKLQL